MTGTKIDKIDRIINESTKIIIIFVLGISIGIYVQSQDTKNIIANEINETANKDHILTFDKVNYYYITTYEIYPTTNKNKLLNQTYEIKK